MLMVNYLYVSLERQNETVAMVWSVWRWLLCCVEFTVSHGKKSDMKWSQSMQDCSTLNDSKLFHATFSLNILLILYVIFLVAGVLKLWWDYYYFFFKLSHIHNSAVSKWSVDPFFFCLLSFSSNLKCSSFILRMVYISSWDLMVWIVAKVMSWGTEVDDLIFQPSSLFETLR